MNISNHRAPATRSATLVLLTALLLAACIPSASAQELPSGPVPIVRAELEPSPPTAPATLIHAVLEFAPGTRFPPHVHGGPALYTLVGGAVQVFDLGHGPDREAGVAEAPSRVYAEGESYGQEVGHALAAAHARGEPAVMAVAFLLPQEETLTTFLHEEDSGAPAPEMLHSVQLPAGATSEGTRLIQIAFELDPGVRTPVHSHRGPSLATVLEGEISVRAADGEARRVVRGEGWQHAAGTRYELHNPGTAPARYVVTHLVERGAALSEVHE